jgi:hypothetical protein
VITIKDRSDKEGQAVIVENKYSNRNSSQIWRVVYTNAMGSEAYRKKGQMSKNGTGFRVLEEFYLRSRLPFERVAECVGANNVVLKKYAKGRKA